MQQGMPQFSDKPPLGPLPPQSRQQRSRQGGQPSAQSKADGKRDVSQRVLCPPERYISVPTTDLQEAFRGQFSPEDFERFTDICKLFEANSRLDFITVSRRVQDNFRLFSAAARGVLVPMKKGAELPGVDELDQKELRFLEDFCNLLVTAHYRLLTEEEWETATDEEFTFNMPIEVNWKAMDPTLLGRFWSGHPQLRRGTAELLERTMVFHRGIHTARSKGLYIQDKIDLLLGYLLVNPLAAFIGSVMGWEAKEKTKKYSPLTASNDHAPVADLSQGEGHHSYESARLAGLEHPNAKVVKRVTLQRLMPDAGSVLKLALTTLEIQEPCFTDMVILYRKSKEVLDRPSSEKDPLPKYSKGMAMRNMVVKSFHDVPMADMEMIFPEKKVFIKPVVLIQLLVTVVLALITIITTISQSKVNLSLLASLASIAAARAAQVWSRAQLARQQMQDDMTSGLYEKSADSQEGVLHTVLNQMSDQHTKEVILAYAVLLLRGEPVSQDGLDKRCELWLERVFGLRLDFAIENSLPVCLEDGVIERNGQGLLTPLSPAKALEVLKHKWEHHFDKQTSGGAEVKVPGAEPITQERPYDMSITAETYNQPEPQPIPKAAPTKPTTVTQRRPSNYDQGTGQHPGTGAGQYTGAGQNAAVRAKQNTGAKHYHGSGGLYTDPSKFAGTGIVSPGQLVGVGGNMRPEQLVGAKVNSPRFAGVGQNGGSSQFAGAALNGASPLSAGAGLNVSSERAYSGSPRFSSTPVDWGSAPKSSAPDNSYRGFDQSGRAGQNKHSPLSVGAGQIKSSPLSVGAGQNKSSPLSLEAGQTRSSPLSAGAGQNKTLPLPVGAGLSVATEQAYSGSPRLSSTPVDWGSAAKSSAPDSSYRGFHQTGGAGQNRGSPMSAGAGLNVATERAYSGSPRLSSTPVDWGSAPKSSAPDSSYRGFDQSGRAGQKKSSPLSAGAGVDVATERAYSGSPRLSSTPVNWGSATASAASNSQIRGIDQSDRTAHNAGSGQSHKASQYAGVNSGLGQSNTAVAERAYSGSPRLSSTPVDWGSTSKSSAPDSSYRGFDQSGSMSQPSRLGQTMGNKAQG